MWRATSCCAPGASTPASCCLAFDPKGQWLATPCWDGTLRLRDPHSNKVLALFAHNTADGWDAVHPSGKMLASGSLRSTAAIFATDFREATPQEREHIQKLIARWEDDSYEVREEASEEIRKIGWIAEPL